MFNQNLYEIKQLWALPELKALEFQILRPNMSDGNNITNWTVSSYSKNIVNLQLIFEDSEAISLSVRY